MSENRPRVLITGYYGFRNAGDEAILAGMLASLKAERADLEFVVVSNDPFETQSTHRVGAVHWQDSAGLAAAAESSSLILIGGGGLFQDYWGFDPTSFLTRRQGGISHYGGSALLAALLEKPCMIYGVGVGPLRSSEAQEWTRWLVDLVDVVAVRDEGSKDTLVNLGCRADGILVTTDPAFGVGIKVGAENGEPHEFAGLPRPIVGVSLRYWPPDEDSSTLDWIEQLAGGLGDFLDQTGGSAFIIPFQDGSIPLEDDLEVSRRARNLKALANRSAVASVSRTPLQRYRMAVHCDIVLGVRLHAVVAAVQAAVPCVGIAYDPKVKSLMERVGQAQYVLNLEGLDSRDVASSLREIYKRRAPVGQQLGEAAARMNRMARENARLAVSLLGTSPQREIRPDTLRLFALSHINNLAEAERDIEIQSENIRGLEARQTMLDNLIASRGWRLIRAVRLFKQAARSPLLALRWTQDLLWRADPAIRRLALMMGRIMRAGLRLFKPTGLYTLYLAIRASRYEAIDRSNVVLYTRSDELFADYSPREQLLGRGLRHEPVSLVATIKDEAEDLPGWFDGLLSQTRRPDEVVVVDGGSSDASLAILERFAEAHGAWFRVIVELGANIARGRNVGISAAVYPTVAVTDVGCDLDPRWLELLMAPFESDEAIEVVAGGYRSSSSTRVGRASMRWLVPQMDLINPQSFIPSSRSMALRKSAWEAVGGYPEWLTLTGEDTYFSLELKRTCRNWAFVPEAVVTWHAPTGVGSFVRKASNWASGDGEAGLFVGSHWRNIAQLIGLALVVGLGLGILIGFGSRAGWALVMAASVVSIALVSAATYREGSRSGGAPFWGILGRPARAYGFLKGLGRRPQVNARRYRDIRGLFLILAGVPIEDTGGGSRSAQLAQELLRQDFLVNYVHRFPSYESRNLELTFRHPALSLSTLNRFDWEAFAWEYGRLLNGRPLTVVIEFPLPEFLPIIRNVKRRGGRAVYDLLDDWETSLGAGWHSNKTEQEIIGLSDVLMATAPTLVQRLEAISGRKVEYLPNAVNLKLFNREMLYRRPTDLPPGDAIIIYVGALWGEWFDWDLLRALALACPEANLVLVGDYRGQLKYPPSNVSFLGLKPQVDLPAYLAHSNVAIIPWKVSPITHATSPLKVYEYLAMDVPVVAPRLDALEGIPGVEMADGEEGFLEAVGRSLATQRDVSSFHSFVMDNSWEARVGRLLTLVGPADPARVKARVGEDDKGEASNAI